MNLKKKIKNSYFAKSLDVIKKNKNLFFYVLLFDVLFVASLYGISNLMSFAIKDLRNFSLNLLFFSLFYIIFYFFLIIFIYSFFKYSVLDFLKSFFGKTEFSFKRLKNFYLLNIIIFGSSLLLFLILNLIFVFNVKRQFLPIFSLIILIPFAFFLYSLINISHSLFLENFKVKDSFLKGLRVTFKKIPSYISIFLFNILILIIYLIIYYIIGLILKATVFGNYQAYLQYYGIYVKIFTIITTIVLYLLIFVNRVSFYMIVRGKFSKKNVLS